VARVIVAINHWVPSLKELGLDAHPILFGIDPDDESLPKCRVLGRIHNDPSVHVVVQGPSTASVSRKHLEISVEDHDDGPRFFVRNFASNGTKKNGEKIPEGEATPFIPGVDQISFGAFCLEFIKLSKTAWTVAIILLDAEARDAMRARHGHTASRPQKVQDILNEFAEEHGLPHRTLDI